MSENRKYVGEVSVNSGQLLIVDPVFIDDNWQKGNTFTEICEASGSDQGSGEVINSMAFAFNTYWGDGKYNVYQVTNENGEIVKMEIELTNPSASDVLNEYDYDEYDQDDDSNTDDESGSIID